MKPIKRSNKLNDVCYDIRGSVHKAAKQLEEDGHRVLKLNIGNPAPFGFEAPDDIVKDVIRNLPTSQGYTDAQGIYSARVAIMQYYQHKGLTTLSIDDIYLGNGVSELIMMSMQGLLDSGDEVLLPSPDYPLWTAAVSLSGGTPVHYLCDEENEWNPSIEDIRAKVTSNTRAMVIINPNNPTGAVYSNDVLKAMLQVAREHDLIIFCDEIYDKVLYDGATHTTIGTLSDDVLCVTLSGLSKNYRIAGFRAGWMILTGPKDHAKDYIEGLNMLSSMRLCANVPCQHAIQTALGGYQSINELIVPGGRLYEQMDTAHRLINEIPGLSAVRPKGAMYLFPKIDIERFNIFDDELFVLDFLKQKKVLLVHGTGFNWPKIDHFRIVFLPHVNDLTEAIYKLGDFLESYQQKPPKTLPLNMFKSKETIET